MKVLMVVRGLDYGFGAHVEPLIEKLVEIGMEVDLLNAKGDMKAALAPWYHPKRFKEADIVHYQGSPYNMMPTGKPTVLTVHTLLGTELEYTRSIAFRVGLTMEPHSIRNADKIIAVNKCLVHEILSIDNEADITVIQNGVKSEEFDCINVASKSNDRCPVVLAGGRLVARKGFMTLIEAMNKVEPPFKLKIFGNGPLMPMLQNEMNRLLGDAGQMLGFVPRKALVNMYKVATVFVCSSEYETGPITVLEAMAAGTPVVCSDMDAIEGVVRHGSTGLIFKRGDAQSLADQLEIMLSDSTFSRQMAAEARQHVKSSHGWLYLARATAKVYEDLLEAP